VTDPGEPATKKRTSLLTAIIRDLLKGSFSLCIKEEILQTDSSTKQQTTSQSSKKIILRTAEVTVRITSSYFRIETTIDSLLREILLLFYRRTPSQLSML
jgi:hypothetical protein